MTISKMCLSVNQIDDLLIIKSSHGPSVFRAVGNLPKDGVFIQEISVKTCWKVE